MIIICYKTSQYCQNPKDAECMKGSYPFGKAFEHLLQSFRRALALPAELQKGVALPAALWKI
jgi:hypothetical protein